jgi:LruC domain-containing protein
MFEDLWPAKGDYDLNDLVLKLRVEIYNNASNKWVGGKWDVVIWANGASMDLGCGIEFFNYMGTSSGKYRLRYLANDQVALVPGTFDASITSLDPAVQNGVILFDNVDNAKPVDYWNTGSGIAYEPVTVSFEYTLASQQNMMAGFLYLFRTSDRGHEIRTFGIPPTTAANTALLGTNFDNSPTTPWDYTPGTEFLYPLDPPYYSTANLHPWGVEIEYSGNLRVAMEQTSIIDAFPQFAAWAESGGSLNTNWYSNPDISKTFDVGALISE